MVDNLSMRLVRFLRDPVSLRIARAVVIVHLEIVLTDDTLLTVAIARDCLFAPSAPATNSDDAGAFGRAREGHVSILALGGTF